MADLPPAGGNPPNDPSADPSGPRRLRPRRLPRRRRGTAAAAGPPVAAAARPAPPPPAAPPACRPPPPRRRPRRHAPPARRPPPPARPPPARPTPPAAPVGLAGRLPRLAHRRPRHPRWHRPPQGAWPPPGFVPPAPAPARRRRCCSAWARWRWCSCSSAASRSTSAPARTGRTTRRSGTPASSTSCSFDEKDARPHLQAPGRDRVHDRGRLQGQGHDLGRRPVRRGQGRRSTSTEASFRALGLIGGDVDLFKSQNDIQGGGTLAYYSPEDKKVRVRGTELDVATRVTLAHELTHALQDQYYDLSPAADRWRPTARPPRSGRWSRATPRWSRTPTSTSSPRPTRRPTTSQNQKQADTADYGNDPQVLVATFTSPYIIGPPFVEALKAKGGNNAINEALQNPPASEAALLDIFTFLDEQVPVDGRRARRSPTATTKVDDGDFGATTWYLMLAQRIDVPRGHQGGRRLGRRLATSPTPRPTARSASRPATRARPQADTDAMYERPEGLGRGRAQRRAERRRQPRAASSSPRATRGRSATLKGSDQSMAAIEMLGLRLQVVSEAFKANAPTTDRRVRVERAGRPARPGRPRSERPIRPRSGPRCRPR